jgi:hypothetical protein
VEAAAQAIPQGQKIFELYKQDIVEFVSVVKSDVVKTAHHVSEPIVDAFHSSMASDPSSPSPVAASAASLPRVPSQTYYLCFLVGFVS